MGRERFVLHRLGFNQARDALGLAKMPFTDEGWRMYRENLKADRQRLFNMIGILNEPTKKVLENCFPQETPSETIDFLNRLIKFDHAALLVISPIDLIRDWLKQKDFKSAISFPSAIVSKRLGERYLEKGEIPTTIVKAEKPNKRKMEVFIPQVVDKNLLNRIVQTDINQELERHFAFMPKEEINEAGLAKLAITITENGFKSEGGGINPTEGLTTLYFTRKGESEKPVRIELICQGQFEQVVENHKKMVI